MKKQILILPLAMVALLLVASPHIASAHERQVIQIGNTDYLFVVGSLNEPITVDDSTGVDLRVLIADPTNASDSKAPGAKPVEGLDQALKVEISAGDKKKTFDLSPAFRDPGAYRAKFYPTIQTALTYRFFGTINSVPVDLSFSCNPAGHPKIADDKSVVKISDNATRKLKAGAFGCPSAKADLGFPEQSAATYDLVNKDKALDGTIAEARAQANSSRSLGITGIVIGLLGLIAGAGAWMKGRKV